MPCALLSSRQKYIVRAHEVESAGHKNKSSNSEREKSDECENNKINLREHTRGYR